MSDLVIRIRTEQKTHKVSLPGDASVSTLRQKTLERLVQEESVPEWATFQIATTQDGSGELTDDTASLEAAGLSHGSMVYVYGLSSGESERRVSKPPQVFEPRPSDIESVRPPIPSHRERLLPARAPPPRANPHHDANGPGWAQDINNYWPFSMFARNANAGGERLGHATQAPAPDAATGVHGLHTMNRGYGAIPTRGGTGNAAGNAAGQRLQQIFFTGVTVRILAIFDGLQLLFDVIAPTPLQPFFVCLIWGPIVGYLAGTRYVRGMSLAYGVYWLLRFNIYLYLAICGVYPLLQVISMLFCGFMLFYVFRFWIMLQGVSEGESALLNRPVRDWVQEANGGVWN
mmetsp:Transcript_13969/g.52157  ORF Transcript_13969/g.52157 Transcript_13969/m.52157 type:complete len:345 (-) Transcript_13969:60-1094(-)